MHWHTQTAPQLGELGTGATGSTLWPSGSTSRIYRLVQETTCSYECELKAINKCLCVIIRRQRGGAVLQGRVIFTDCLALVQVLGGYSSERVGGAVLLSDYLQETEG
ncbi:hypothetical protein PoB_000811300 [Plakobranchus ocellatus]|uniref:Uncharacterized protein n=1 Tax=Plakobranchus ocellatus TaxID=259542 RepID=A0AAV3YHI7_9GAST|nr:hypothetical protein PoB_000811300 [Plakobranchus ocellatus]